MDDAEMLATVRAMRAKGSPPKVIGKALGLPQSQVAPLIRQVAQESNLDMSSGAVSCWLSPGWSRGLTVKGDHDWPDGDEADPDRSESGVALALVARSARRGHVTVAGYLIDVYCLGVKNAMGPRRMDDGRGLTEFRRTYFDIYERPPLSVPLDLLQHLVLGAVEYSRELGFEPHKDFAAVADHLGEWAGPSDIVFGLDGKPCYVQGPYDNTPRVMRTLRDRVGADGFHFVTAAP